MINDDGRLSRLRLGGVIAIPTGRQESVTITQLLTELLKRKRDSQPASGTPGLLRTMTNAHSPSLDYSAHQVASRLKSILHNARPRLADHRERWARIEQQAKSQLLKEVFQETISIRYLSEVCSELWGSGL